MVSLYRDPKGEHVIPTSLATTSDVKRSIKLSKPTADRSDMEATINMYKNRILELEDEVGRVREISKQTWTHNLSSIQCLITTNTEAILLTQKCDAGAKSRHAMLPMSAL